MIICDTILFRITYFHGKYIYYNKITRKITYV